MSDARITVVGGGLAGSEAAWQLAERGHDVTVHEMRPVVKTAAHQTESLAELVCSNTFKSTETSNAHGLLKAEMRALGSLILRAADEARVPGGSALAVDREVFSAAVHRWVTSHPRIELVRDEVTQLPSPGIVATGPLTSDALSATIQKRLGVESLAFYDAIAPIVAGESIDASIVFRASRYGKETMSGADAVAAPGASDLAGEGAYVNCPFTREQYEVFLDALIVADQYEGHDFDPVPYFEGCMPVEEMARRGRETLRFGPMKPVGLRDPRSGREAYAIAQLRMEDRGGRMWNVVGFQTRLRTREQQRVFRMIPGLADAEFLRWGSVHRNSYVNAAAALTRHLSLRDDPMTLFAGINLARLVAGEAPVIPPPTTMLGALYRYLHEADPRHFQPMNANFGLLDELEVAVRDKRRKRELMAERALRALDEWSSASGITAAGVA